MKPTRIIGRFALPLLIALAGCGKDPEAKPKATPTTPPEKSTLQTAVDGFTGKTAVDAGQRAKEQIKAASAARNKNMEEMGQ
jgi:hypothetical protein